MRRQVLVAALTVWTAFGMVVPVLAPEVLPQVWTWMHSLAAITAYTGVLALVLWALDRAAMGERR